MAEFTVEVQPLSLPSVDPNGVSLKNVKEVKLDDGTVSIRDGAFISRDETGTDRVIFGRLEGGF